MSTAAELKASLNDLLTSGADADTISAAVEELVAQSIVEAKPAGKKWTPEQRAALSEKLKGRAGKPMSDEARQKIKDSWTPEKRAQLGEKLRGRTLTEEQRARLSNSLKAGKAAKEAQQAAMQARIAELEARLQGQSTMTSDAADEAVAEVSSEPVAEAPARGRGRR